MEKFKILSILFAVIAVIGLIRFIGETGVVNAGVFIFPAILAGLFAVLYIRKNRGE